MIKFSSTQSGNVIREPETAFGKAGTQWANAEESFTKAAPAFYRDGNGPPESRNAIREGADVMREGEIPLHENQKARAQAEIMMREPRGRPPQARL